METSDKIKKGLEHCSEDDCKGCCYEHDCNMADGFSVLAYDALACIEQLEAALPQWISVDERLPEDPCCVLVNLLGYVNVAWYRCDGTFEMASGNVFDGECIHHWMPLPLPPKKEENEIS